MTSYKFANSLKCKNKYGVVVFSIINMVRRNIEFEGLLIFYNEPELGAEIDPGMALTPLPSSIERGSNSKLSIVSRML